MDNYNSNNVYRRALEESVLSKKDGLDEELRMAELITERFLSFVPLTDKELRVYDMKLPSINMSDREIGEELGIPKTTINWLFKKALKKVNAFKRFFTELYSAS